MSRGRSKIGLIWTVEQGFGAKFANSLQTLRTLIVNASGLQKSPYGEVGLYLRDSS